MPLHDKTAPSVTNRHLDHLATVHDQLQELIIVDLYPPVVIRVEATKCFGESANRHADLDEIVKRHTALPSLIKLPNRHIQHPITQVKPERQQRGLQLPAIDAPAPVSIELLETPLPVLDVAPERGELVEADGAGVVAIEQVDHQTHGFNVELFPIAVDERALEFFDGEVTGFVSVEGVEPEPKLIVLRLSLLGLLLWWGSTGSGRVSVAATLLLISGHIFQNEAA